MSILETVKSKRELKVLVDQAGSRKTYKKALKQLVSEYTSEEFVNTMRELYTNSIVTTTSTLDTFMSLFPEGTTTEELFNYELPKKGESWDMYNAAQTAFRLKLRLEALEVNDKFKQNTNTMLKVLVDTFAKTDRDTVILNSLAGKIASIWGGPEDSAAVHLGMWGETGLLSYSVMTNQASGAREHMYELHLDVMDARSVYINTSDRKLRFGDIESVESKDILIKKKYPYAFTLDTTDAIEAIDHINDCTMSLNLPEDKIESIARRKVFGNDLNTQDKLSEPWHMRILEQTKNHYNLVHEMGNRFRVTHKADGVFRLYDSEDYFSPQQGEYVREYLEFADKEELTETGKKWIKIKIAGENGYSKKLEEEALKAFDENETEWRELEDNKHLFAVLDGGETGYMLELDAQSQNYAIYGLTSGCKDLADMTGYNPDSRLDLREVAAPIMNAKLNTTVWSKDTLKSPIMTKAYSAKFKTLMFGSKYNEDNGEVKQDGRQTPLMLTSDASKDDTWAAFSETMELIAPRALRIMEDIEEKAKRNTNVLVNWLMPDGVKCQIAMQETVETELVWVDANGKMHKAKHHVREMDPKAGVTAHAPRYIQSIDAYLLRLVSKMLKDLGIAFTAVHDGYIVHPNHGDTLCECYRAASLQVWKENVLSNIVNQTMGSKVNYQAKGDITEEYINNSKYSLWV